MYQSEKFDNETKISGYLETNLLFVSEWNHYLPHLFLTHILKNSNHSKKKIQTKPKYEKILFSKAWSDDLKPVKRIQMMGSLGMIKTNVALSPSLSLLSMLSVLAMT